MQRPKKVLVILVLLMVLITTYGCSNHDTSVVGPELGNIVGTWYLTGISSQAGGQVYNVPAAEVAADPLSYTFFDDKTGTQFYQGTESDFTWSISGQSLTTLGSWGETSTYDYSVTLTKLTLTFPVEGYTVTHTFTRQN
ncbi:MAG: lipocalin family protein [bacterium]